MMPGSKSRFFYSDDGLPLNGMCSALISSRSCSTTRFVSYSHNRIITRIGHMWKTYCAGGCLLFSISTGAFGYTGDDMLQRCKYDPQGTPTIFEADQFGYCRGAVQMMIDLSRVLDPTLRFCVPDNYTIEQAIDIVVRHLENVPGERDRPFVVLAHSALFDAWGCK
jgi:hypothetical protein